MVILINMICITIIIMNINCSSCIMWLSNINHVMMIITLKITKNDLSVISVIVFTISVMISINEKHNNHKK